MIILPYNSYYEDIFHNNYEEFPRRYFLSKITIPRLSCRIVIEGLYIERYEYISMADVMGHINDW